MSNSFQEPLRESPMFVCHDHSEVDMSVLMLVFASWCGPFSPCFYADGSSLDSDFGGTSTRVTFLNGISKGVSFLSKMEQLPCSISILYRMLCYF